MINDPKKAEINYQRLIKNKYADEKPEVYLYYADALRAQGKYAEALPVYEQYLVKAPNDPLAMAGKAGCEMNEIKNPDESRWAVRPIKEINSSDDDFGAVYTDSKFNSILFTSNRKGTIGKEKDNWTDGYFSDFFTSAKGKSENYTAPVLADDRDLINTKANEGAGCFDDQFKKFYFTRCEKMNKDKEYCRIFEATKAGNSWGRPQLLYADSLGNAGQPAISTNGLWMIIASNRPGGQGGKDLWKLTRSSERKPFSNPENLGSIINTPGDELFPTLFADTVLYFASNGRPGFGGLDIYRVILGKNGQSNIEHLPRPINSFADDFAMNFETNKERGFLTSRRDGGKGGDDIYYFEKLNRRISLKGSVKDEITGLPLEKNPVLLTTTTNDTSKFVTDASGNFLVSDGVLEENNNYRLIFSKDNYFSKTSELYVGKLNSDTTYLLDISLLPIPEKPIVLPDIYYDLNKWDLLPQYQDSLMVLVKILNDNPKITIELASHTDSRATDAYNDTLSLRRAETVVQFLTEKGINKDRLTAKGYGEQVPRVLSSSIIRDGFSFEKGTKLTEAFILAIRDEKKREAAFQLNRRTEFSVTGKNFK
jgi:peptidoglycan-associated lipoprotein